MPEDRRAILQQYSYEDLWEQLYFNELIAIVKRSWQHFSKFFSSDQEQVMRMLEHINASRADAHARSIAEDNLAYLRVCFRKMEELLRLRTA